MAMEPYKSTFDFSSMMRDIFNMDVAQVASQPERKKEYRRVTITNIITDQFGLIESLNQAFRMAAIPATVSLDGFIHCPVGEIEVYVDHKFTMYTWSANAAEEPCEA